jgi:hypothetical protein
MIWLGVLASVFTISARIVLLLRPRPDDEAGPG